MRWRIWTAISTAALHCSIGRWCWTRISRRDGILGGLLEDLARRAGRRDRAHRPWMRLSPLGPDMERMEVGNAMAYLLSGRTEDALLWAEKASLHKSDQALPISILAAIYARAGRGNEARLAVQQLRRLNPGLRQSKLGEWLPFDVPNRDNFANGNCPGSAAGSSCSELREQTVRIGGQGGDDVPSLFSGGG